nr:MAG TPA: hypothetical protein [Caudoviricetes sp.]
MRRRQLRKEFMSANTTTMSRLTTFFGLKMFWHALSF